jgi:hypothetical protein
MKSQLNQHKKKFKQLLKYVKSTKEYALIYSKQNGKPVLQGFSDADHAGDL